MVEVTGVVNLSLFAWLRLGPIRTHSSKQDEQKIDISRLKNAGKICRCRTYNHAEQQLGGQEHAQRNKEW